MNKIFLVTIFILTYIALYAHPWKPRHYVIVDTDGGLDDLKSICMLLASPDVRLLAVTVSDGFHKSPDAYKNVRSLLDSDIYWELVRQNAIKYWVLFDRHDIFDTETIN